MTEYLDEYSSHQRGYVVQLESHAMTSTREEVDQELPGNCLKSIESVGNVFICQH